MNTPQYTYKQFFSKFHKKNFIIFLNTWKNDKNIGIFVLFQNILQIFFKFTNKLKSKSKQWSTKDCAKIIAL